MVNKHASSHGGCIVAKNDVIRPRPPSAPLRWPPWQGGEVPPITPRHQSRPTSGYLTSNNSPPPVHHCDPPPARANSGRFSHRASTAPASTSQLVGHIPLPPGTPRTPTTPTRNSPLSRCNSLQITPEGAANLSPEVSLRRLTSLNAVNSQSAREARSNSLGGNSLADHAVRRIQTAGGHSERRISAPPHLSLEGMLPTRLHGDEGAPSSPLAYSPLAAFASKPQDSPKRFHAKNEKHSNKITASDWKADRKLKDWYRGVVKREVEDKMIVERAASKDDKRIWKVISRQHQVEALRRKEHEEFYSSAVRQKPASVAALKVPLRKSSQAVAPMSPKPNFRTPTKSNTPKKSGRSRPLRPTCPPVEAPARPRCSLEGPAEEENADNDIAPDFRSKDQSKHIPAIRALKWKIINDRPVGKKPMSKRTQDISIWVNPGVFVTRTVQS